MPMGSLTARPVLFKPKSIPIILSILVTNIRKIMPSPKKIHIIALTSIIGACIIISLSLLAIIFRNPDEELRNEIAINEMKIDSLERSIYRWELYSRNLRDVLQGKTPIQIDSLLKTAGASTSTATAVASARADSTLRVEMNSPERKNAHGRNYSAQALEGRHFFTPVQGYVTGTFEISLHPYVDVSAPEGSPVKAVLDGTIIFKDWNETDGWSVVVQHSGGAISIYKHNDSILKNPAEKVSAGTVIAILGNSSLDAAKGPHLHFELWHNGMPEDPSRFINFQQ